MKTSAASRPLRAMTWIEILVVLFVLVVLAGLLLPALVPAKRKAKRINCVNNLKQVGLGLRMWAGENDDRFPTEVSTNKGGSAEWKGTLHTYQHFLPASNEIVAAKVLICPSDYSRSQAASFSALQNQNISYFINLSAAETNDMPQVLGGDRHLSLGGKQFSTGSHLVSTQQVPHWGTIMHGNGGNLLMIDGSVQQTRDATLQKAIMNDSYPTNWLAFP